MMRPLPKRFRPGRILHVLLAACGLVCFSANAFAVPLIRDAEIEHTLRLYADPIFRVDGLKPSAVTIFIVEDDSLNSYVAGGANIFIHTGLLMDCDTPDMVIGVIAHETGHIVGGHLAQGGEKLKDAQMGSILSFVLGAAAAAASGRPEAAAAVITGGQNTVGRNFLAFTRAHEESADQSALGALDKLHISASGLLKTFEMLRRHEREHGGSPDPYLLTHPLTSLRIEHVRDHVETSKIPEGQYPRGFDILHQRMVAKLYGFLEPPEHTMAKYPLSNKSVPARLARAIAYYKLPDTERALAEMNSLIKESPNDPFFHELKGQILFESNHPKEALASYQTAVKLLPDSALILADLAKVEMGQHDPSLYASAVSHLEHSTALDATNAGAWHMLAGAYDKVGNSAMMALSLAEEAILEDDTKMALSQVDQALRKLSPGSPARQRAQDIKAQALDMKRAEKEEQSPF
jgi:predicted Zn-dependent protease